MRVTTNMMIRNYQTNLNKSLSSLDATRTRVMTKRNFNKVSEDPAAAAKAFRLRNDYSKNEDYLETVKTLQGEMASVEASAMQIKDYCDEVLEMARQADGGAMNAEQRAIVAASIREKQKSILLSINAKFGNKFLFGGSDTKNIPFELSEDGKTLTYRGLDVNDPANADALKALTSDKLYTDLGFGLGEELSKVSGSTISLKYGTDTISFQLKESITIPGTPPAADTVQHLDYSTWNDAINSMNILLANDSSLGDLKGKIQVANDGGKLKIEYTDPTDPANKDLKIIAFSNSIVNEALGLTAGASMSAASSITGGAVTLPVPAGALDDKKVTVKYGNASYDLTFPANGTYNNMNDIVTELNGQIAANPALAGKLTFSDNGGKLELGYDPAIAAADKKGFSISGDADALTTLGLTNGSSVSPPDIGGTAPSVPITEERYEIIDSTAYNAAISGLNLLGYGSENGISKNVLVLMGQMADNLSDPNFVRGSNEPYQKVLAELRDNVLEYETYLGTKSKFLEDTQKRLEDNEFTLNEQIVGIENVDMAFAITEYMWAQYAYNAALKVGNSLLSSSFIDFMS